jgi:hypothetical protein
MAAKNAATAQQQPIDSGRPWFPVSAGLLTRKHYERLGAAWMEFLWFVHQQYAPKNGEVDTGVVRNGNLISYPEISAALGLPLRTVERHVALLEREGYMRSKHVNGKGKIYWVGNPIRWSMTATSAKSARVAPATSGGLFDDTLATSGETPPPEVASPPATSGEANKEARTTNNTQELNPTSEHRSDPASEQTDRAHGKTKQASPDAVALASELLVEIRGNKPDYHITDERLAKWAQSADLMLRRDGRSPPQVSALIRWVQRDEFWKSNVLSMDKLREKFDQLEMKMHQLSRKGGSNNGNGKRDLAEYLENEMRIAHEYAARTGS